MLYKTHQKYGKLSGYIAIPIAVTAGLIPVITFGMRFSDAVMVGMVLIVAVLSASFGSEFPDCDSYGGRMSNGEMKKGSIPSQKHPFISRMFKMFGVKHRGKFSHDYASLAVFFGLTLVATKYGMEYLVKQVSQGSSLFSVVSQLLVFFAVYLISDELVSKYKFVLKNGKVSTLQTRILELSLFSIISVILIVAGFLNPFMISSSVHALKSTVLLASISKVFVIFSWVGAYSHLFADMMTNEGVNIFGMRLAPAKVVLKLRKIPLIGPFLLRSNLRTGSPYEDMCSLIVSILCVPAVVLTVVSVTGGDIPNFLRVIGILK